MLTVVKPQKELSEYGFKKDAAGNYIIPGSVFGGTQNVRLKGVCRNTEDRLLVIEIVAVIMSVTGKSRDAAGEVWRNFPEETKKLIQADLMENEGEIFVIK